MKFLEITKFYVFITINFLALNVIAAEPSNSERIQKSGAQVMSAFLLEFELQNDINCKFRKYADLDWNEWTSSFPGNSGDEKNKNEAVKSLKEAIEVMKKTKSPNSDKTLSQVLYASMKDPLIKQNTEIGSKENYCDQLYGAAKSLFQKSKDNLKLYKTN